MNNISFGSNYKIYVKGDDEYRKFLKMLNDKTLKPEVSLPNKEDRMIERNYQDNFSDYIIFSGYTDDKYDNLLKNYCDVYGIKIKQNTKPYKEDLEIMVSHVVPASNNWGGYFVSIDTDKFEDFVLSQENLDDIWGNVPHILTHQDEFQDNPEIYQEQARRYPVMPTELRIIKNDDGKLQFINFDGNKNAYPTLKKAGAKAISLMMDKETFDICREFGLLSDKIC